MGKKYIKIIFFALAFILMLSGTKKEDGRNGHD